MKRFFVSQRNCYTAAATACLIIMLLFAIAGRIPEMSAFGIVSGVLLLFANLDSLSKGKVSATGFEFELKHTIHEAKDVIDQLKVLAGLTSETTLSLVMRAGRLGGYSDEEKIAIRKSVDDLMKNLQLSEELRQRALADWHKFEAYDYTLFLLGHSQIPREIQSNSVAIDEWKQLRHGGLDHPASPDQIRAFLSKYGMLDQESEERIQDYAYYLAHREHRRPADWSTRTKWRGSA